MSIVLPSSSKMNGYQFMESIQIRTVTLKDLEDLQALSKQTFFETFASANTEANMNKYLEEQLSVGRVTAELSNPGSDFYFAVLSGRPIGYLKLNFGQSQTEVKSNESIEIERIYVLKEYHGKKVGQLLYEKAIEVAKARDAQFIWLGVWEQNARAISFYTKNGFVQFDKHNFRLGDDEQTDIMMKLAL